MTPEPTSSQETPEPIPPLPIIANYYFQQEKLAAYSNALSDVLCWLDGFTSGGGIYSPQTQEVLRDLNCAVKSVQENRVSGDSYTHKSKSK